MSGLLLIMPTRGEYRAVAAAVERGRGPVELRMCGVGPRRAAALCTQLEQEVSPERMVLLGWAGALADDLGVGDIVMAGRALSAGCRDVECALLPLARPARVRCGPVLTTGHVLATPEAKRAAARCGALAVEMEAYPLAAWAAQRGIPFVHGRVILDPVDDALPELDGVLDAYGRVRVRNLLQALARRPASLAVSARLPFRLAAANRRLAELAAAVIAASLPASLPASTSQPPEPRGPIGEAT